MIRRIAALSALALMVSGSTSVLGAQASSSASTAKPTILLVHGAFADGTGWQNVIPLLQRDGYTVIAVQNPLTSFSTDVESTKRVIDAQQGSVVVVGHSYGGAVMTDAAASASKVKALVYIAAFAPEAGEAVGAFLEKYPSPLGSALRPDAAGFLYVDRGRFREIFASDLPEAQVRVIAATQKPIIGTAFGAVVTQVAWKNIPSWYVVAQEDKAVNPELQRFYAKRMGAKIVELKGSHALFASRPREIARVIEQAASAPVRMAETP